MGKTFGTVLSRPIHTSKKEGCHSIAGQGGYALDIVKWIQRRRNWKMLLRTMANGIKDDSGSGPLGIEITGKFLYIYNQPIPDSNTSDVR